MPKTIFILGAGASHSYGFPLGQGLVDEIIKNLSPIGRYGDKLIFSKESQLVQILSQRMDGTFIADFAKKLSDSETNSIDFFLAKNRKYQIIGKLAITYLILDHQRRLQKGNKIKGGWYKLLWSEINSRGTDEYDFSIYTFNYDRSLSLYLKKSAMNMFGWDSEGSDLDQYLSKIPITHLHGSVDIEEYGHGIEPLFEVINYDVLQKISDQISVIYEAEINEAFKKFHKEIVSAEHIIFLGFGFHPDNVTRLQMKLNNVLGVNVYSTAFGMSDLQKKTKIEESLKKYMNSKFTNFSIGYFSWDCEEFLKNNFNFRNIFSR